MISAIVAGMAGWLHHMGLGGLARASGPRWLARRLLRHPRGAPAVRTVVSGVGRGLRLWILPETPLAYWLGTHEPETQRVLREQLRPGMVVYDCGANIGYFSAICARLVGPSGRVYAFEPSPRSFDSLAALNRLNGFDQVVPVPRAVWSASGTLRLETGTGGRSTVGDRVEGVMEPAATTPTVAVEAITLDEFVLAQGHPAPHLIKLDVEGSEAAALAGAGAVMARHRPLVLVEVHGAAGAPLWSLFGELGYRCVDIATGGAPTTAGEFAVWIRSYLATPA